jgi:hypothetical protein
VSFGGGAPSGCYGSEAMSTAPIEPLSQRLATIRDQLKLLSDYL